MTHTTPTPLLYVKTGCPWCRQAMDTLEQFDVSYQKVVVTDNPDAMKQMIEISGQGKAPTLNWDGEILADFGSEELIPFLKSRGINAS